MQSANFTVTRNTESVLATNKLIRNTYTLLALTLLFSAMTATVSVFINPPGYTSLITFVGALLLLYFVLPKVAHSSAGLGVVFGITGLLGFGLGPMLSNYLAMPNGSQTVGMAMGGTGVIFMALSGYTLTTRKDFSFLGGFLFAGMIVAIIGIVANIFLQMPLLQLVISAAVILIMSGFILFDTSRMVNGGETNYVNATIGLYLSIFNIFVHLLSILGIVGGDD
jgi:modulator of FtsH protease